MQTRMLAIALSAALAAVVAITADAQGSGAIATAFGLIYTAYSEWVNVYQIGSWGYAPDMPLVFGIGVSPLLQWLVVPLVTLSILRMPRTARLS